MTRGLALVLLLPSAPGWACDAAVLKGLAAELATEPIPPAASELGPRLAAACPRPIGLNRALKAGGEPIEDREAAVTQVGHWNSLCGGLDSIPSGLESITHGQRMEMWTDCTLERFGAFEAHEWIGTNGPAVSVVLLADRLASTEGLDAATRRTLTRAWAGLPEAGQDLPLDLQVGSTPTALPSIVTLAPVRWPAPLDPPDDDADAPPPPSCIAEVDVVDAGAPSAIRWPDCPEELRPYVQSALDGSWFAPGQGASGVSTAGSLRVRFVRDQPSGVVLRADAR
jgi:hypothetical protein